jgi:hypothetical protein
MASEYTEQEGKRLPTKFTLGGVMVYLSPIVWFAWCGAFWKVISLVTVSIGIWRSPGFLRRFFGIALMVSIFIWGAHAKLTKEDWPGPPGLMVWWLGSFFTRFHADGMKALRDAANRRSEWG